MLRYFLGTAVVDFGVSMPQQTATYSFREEEKPA